MNGIRSGEMIFLSADLYPNVITGGMFEKETSTLANPDKEDQEVMGESPEASELVSSEPRKMNLFLAIALIVILAIVFGLN